ARDHGGRYGGQHPWRRWRGSRRSRSRSGGAADKPRATHRGGESRNFQTWSAGGVMDEDPRVRLAEALWNDPDIRPRLLALIQEKFPSFLAPAELDEIEFLERMW